MASSARRPSNLAMPPRTRWLTALAPLLVLLLAGFVTSVPTGAASAAPSTGVTIGGVKQEADGTYTVIVSPPASRATTLLGPEDVVVTVDGTRVSTRARPRDPADLAVAIVVQTAVPAADLAAYKTAAVEALKALPAAASVAVLAAGKPTKVVAPIGTAREAAIAAVSGIQPTKGTTSAPALLRAITQLAKTKRQAVLLFGPVGRLNADELAYVTRGLHDPRAALYVVTPQAGSKAFESMVRATGGRTATTVTGAASDTAAGGQVVTELSTQYLVGFSAPKRLTPTTKLAVAVRGVADSATRTPSDLMPGADAAKPKKGGGKGGLRAKLQDLPKVPIAAGGAAVLVLGVIGLRWRRARRRNRSAPAFAVRTTRAVVSPTPPPRPTPDAVGAVAPDATDALEPPVQLVPPLPADAPPAAPVLDPATAVGDGTVPAAETAPTLVPEHVVHRRPRALRTAAPRTGRVDEALDGLSVFAARWQPRSQAIFAAHEAVAIHQRAGSTVTLDELLRSTALDAVDDRVLAVARTAEALNWALVRRSQGRRWSDVAVEAAAVLRGELEPAALLQGPDVDAGSGLRLVSGQLDRLRSRPTLEDEVPLREPVRAAAIARERVVEYQWFGSESEVISRILVPVLLHDRAPAAAPYLAISRHLGEDTDVSVFYEAATEAADEATRHLVQLRSLRSRYHSDLDLGTATAVELLFSVPVVTAGALAERLDAPAAKVTELMDHLVSAGVVLPLLDPTRRDDPAWVAAEIIDVFDTTVRSGTISLVAPTDGSESAGSEIPDRGTHRRRAAPMRPRRLRARPPT